MDHSTLIQHMGYRHVHQDERTGQALFNVLPDWAAEAVRAKLFDPFYNVKTWQGAMSWISDHLIFNGANGDGELIAVFNGNEILAQID